MAKKTNHILVPVTTKKLKKKTPLKAKWPVSHTQWSLPSPTGQGEAEVPTQTRLTLGLSLLSNRCDSGNSSEKGAQSPHPGPQPTLAQPVPAGSQHPTVPNLREVGPLGPAVLRNGSSSPTRPRKPPPPGGGPSPLPGSRAFVYFRCVHGLVSALPTGGNAFKKIPVINVVSFVVSHCRGSKREFIFLTCLA